MSARFVHLRLHTEYSLVDSVVRIPALVAAVRDAEMPAVAVTDQHNLFAMVKFYRAAQAAGLKPIVGVDLLVRQAAGEADADRLTLLCQDEIGYRNLTRLITRAYLEGQHRGVPLVERDWLGGARTAGLIALSGAQTGDVGRCLLGGRAELAAAALQRWREEFGDRYYIEVCRTGRTGEEPYLHAVVPLASRLGVPLVATNDVRFLRRADYEAHEARICIHRGQLLNDARRPRDFSEQQYLRTADEMAQLFADLPEALDNSVEIARRCNLIMQFGRTSLPEFPTPAGLTAEAHLRSESTRGLAARCSGGHPPADYSPRLERELDVICSMGFAGYFLIVADFIRWARDNDIPVGPGRGSGAGSLVAWSLGITDLDPIEHDLLFERFLNPERVSMPDFDIDFCMEGRDRVIDYVARTYGRERVSQIITYGTMAARAVVRDVGRVLGHPYGYVDRIAKLIPFEIGMTLEKALEQEPELARLNREEEDVRVLLELARSLEGLVRNAGKHAGGVVIAPSRLTDFTPLYCEEGAQHVVTQFDKDDVETVGLVKFDFLGLRTLTIIDRAVKAINAERARRGEAPIDLRTLPMDDPAAFELLNRQSTTAVFQLESRGMRDLIRRLRPDRFEDIVALVALFRPGPLQSGMVEDFIARKHAGQAQAIDYLHPLLQPVLEDTYGVILYQEQVMQIAQVLARYSLGGADLLRRAMGKKKPEEMAQQRSVFVDGAAAAGVAEPTARHIFDLMEKFAGYGFNKSHSAAYAVLSYQTAWLKARYPAAFMAAVLSSDMDHTDKIVTLISDCNELGLRVAPPDANCSSYAFNVASDREIRYGLGAIKGVGYGAVEAIIEERERNGPFASLHQLCRRLDLQRVNRRVIEALIKSGALDSVGPNRASLMAALPEALRLAEQHQRATAAGQSDLFGLAAPRAPADEANGAAEVPAAAVREEWDEAERLSAEKETLGLYLTGHPVLAVQQELRYFTSGTIGDIVADRPAEGMRGSRPCIVAGLVVEVRKRGNRLSLTLDDRTGRIEVMLFDEVYQRHRDVIAADAILVIDGTLRFDDFLDDWRLTARRIQDLDQARECHAQRLVIRWQAETGVAGFVEALEATLRPYRQGRCTVAVVYETPRASARLCLGEEWSVRPSRDLLERLRQLVGGDGVQIVY